MPVQANSRIQTRSSAAQHDSATHTITPTSNTLPSNQSTLRLRGAADPSPPSRRIRWAEDVVDNEGMGKKSSKVCCIYHPPRPAGESSSESDSSSSSDEDSDVGDNGDARPTNRDRSDHDHDHEHSGTCGYQHEQSRGKARNPAKGTERKRSPNAYEKMPKGNARQ